MSDAREPEEPSPSEAKTGRASAGWSWLFDKLKFLKRHIVAVATVGAVLSGLVGYWTTYRAVQGVIAPIAVTTSSPAAGPPFMSVAVMPFTPASADPDDERFAERATQDLTSALGPAMRDALVVSHGLVVARYKDKSIDPRAVGRDLNVRYLMEGDLRDENGRIVATAELVETTNGTQVRSDRVAAPTGGAGKDEIVAQMTNRLRHALSDGEEKRVARLPMANANAMELVLHAAALWDQDPSSKGRLAARKLDEEALRHDSASVPAMLGLMETITDDLFKDHDPRADLDRLTKEWDDLSNRAVQADRDDPRAWEARSFALLWQNKWDGAFEANAEALRVDPYRNTSLGRRGLLLVLTGRPEEALPVLDRAIALDPHSPRVPDYLQFQCSAHVNLGHYDDAIAACENALALEYDWDDYAFLVGAYAQKGDMVKAAAEKAELLKKRPDVSIALLKAPRWRQNPTYIQQREAHYYPGLRRAGIPEQVEGWASFVNVHFPQARQSTKARWTKPLAR